MTTFYEAKLEAVRVDTGGVDEENRVLSAELNQAKAIITSLEVQINEFLHKMRGIEREHENSDEEKAKMKRRITECEEVIAKMTREIAECKREEESLHGIINKFERNLENSLNDTRQRQEETTEIITKYEQEITKLRHETSAEITDCTFSHLLPDVLLLDKALLDGKAKELMNMTKEVRLREKLLHEAEGKIVQLTGELDRTTSMLSSKNVKLEECGRDFAYLKKELIDKTNELENTNFKLKSLEVLKDSEFTQVRQMYEEKVSILKREMVQLEEGNRRLREENEENATEIRRLQQNTQIEIKSLHETLEMSSVRLQTWPLC
jgi:chromosome segregation ATPase